MILINKKGGEKVLSIWWFFVLIVIGTGLVVSISIFNVADTSTKKIEADILIAKVAGCIISNGFVSQDFIDNKLDIFDKCQLDKNLIEKKSGNYYLAYEIYNFDDCAHDNGFSCKNQIAGNSYGVSDLKTQCGIKSANVEMRSAAECSEKYIYTINEKGEKFIIHILASSNQAIKSEV